MTLVAKLMPFDDFYHKYLSVYKITECYQILNKDYRRVSSKYVRKKSKLGGYLKVVAFKAFSKCGFRPKPSTHEVILLARVHSIMNREEKMCLLFSCSS